MRALRFVAYSAPEVDVEIELVENRDGTPIRLLNVPAKGTSFPQIHDHMQFASIKPAHSSEGKKFDWSGRDGFVSRVDLSTADLRILK